MDETLGTLALGLLILFWIYVKDPKTQDINKLDATTKYYLQLTAFGLIGWSAYKIYTSRKNGENNFALFKTSTQIGTVRESAVSPESKFGTVRVSDDLKAPHVLEQPFWNSGTTNDPGGDISAAT